MCGGSLAWASGGPKASKGPGSGTRGVQGKGEKLGLVVDFLEALQQEDADLSTIKETGMALHGLMEGSKGRAKPEHGTPSIRARRHLSDLENQYNQARAKHARLKKQLSDAAEHVERLANQVNDARGQLGVALEEEQEELQGKNEETKRAAEGLTWAGLPVAEDLLEEDPELQGRYKAMLHMLENLNKEIKTKQELRKSAPARASRARAGEEEIEETPYLGLAGSVIATTAVAHRLDDDEDESMEGEGGASAWATVDFGDFKEQLRRDRDPDACQTQFH